MHTKRNYFLHGLAVGFIFVFLPSFFEPFGQFTSRTSDFVVKIFPFLGKSFGWIFIFYGLSLIIGLVVKLIMLMRFGFSVFQNWATEFIFYSLGLALVLSVVFIMAMIAFSRFQPL